jgi:hypothetical protein
MKGQWFSPCTPVSSTNKTDRHNPNTKVCNSNPSYILKLCMLAPYLMQNGISTHFYWAIFEGVTVPLT